jgi:beta-ureidopropionase / N-carbamoyl-L-amino-acid hydrolase
MSNHSINAARLLARLRALGAIGRDGEGKLVRLAASDTDKLGRDQLVAWLTDAGLQVAIDRIGNIFGIWAPEGASDDQPLMLGSHIDTVINAGIYDGCYGVLSGLDVIETLKGEGFSPSRPVVVAAFTNEEGVRYAPDMMGSLVYAGGLNVDEALDGDANHAGTTPISMRRDAGHAAARVITFLRDRAKASNTPTVATVGCMIFEPNAINVIPSRAAFTVDLRDPDEDRLKEEEAALAAFLEKLTAEEQVGVSVERLARFEPVQFDQRIVELVEKAARDRGLASKRMTSGAGHDAQMIARIAPTAMIFVPSIGGISHNPREHTPDADLVAGANILLDVVTCLAAQ